MINKKKICFKFRHRAKIIKFKRRWKRIVGYVVYDDGTVIGDKVWRENKK